MLVFRRQFRSTYQVIDVKDLKFTACQLMYTFMYVYVYESRCLKVELHTLRSKG